MIHYLTEGSGKITLVLIHGFCENNTCLQRQVLFFKDHCKVIIPDLPGFGQSETLGASTMETYADEVLKVLKQEQVENCIMLGHSMGGYVTLAFAEKYPNYLKGFGLLHSTALADNAERIEKRKQVIQFIESNGIDSYINNFIPSLFLNPSSEEVPKAIQEARKSAPQGVIQAVKAMMVRTNKLDLLKKAKVPVLFVLGEKDPLIAANDIYHQASICRMAHLVVLENASHMGMVEQPEEMNSEIKKFIDWCMD